MSARARSIPFPLRKLGQLYRLVRESHRQPLTGEPQTAPHTGPGETAFTFIGHSSFLIQMAGLGLLIDPVFSRRLILLRRQRRAGLLVQSLPRIDAVLLTHAHMDHLDRPSLRAVTREMRRRGLPAPAAIVPHGVSDLVEGLGFRSVTELRWWESAALSPHPPLSFHPPLSPLAPLSSLSPSSRLAPSSSPPLSPVSLVSPLPALSPDASLSPDAFLLSFRSAAEESAFPAATAPALTITATPAKHWGARMFNDTHRGFGGYVLAAPGSPTLYHSGDTASFSGFIEIGQRLRPEIAMLPIGAYYPDSYRTVHTSPEEALEAFRDLGATSMVPMHFGTFRLGREPMSEPLPRLLAAARSQGLADSIHPLAEGETWIVPATVVHPGLGDVAEKVASYQQLRTNN